METNCKGPVHISGPVTFDYGITLTEDGILIIHGEDE